MRSVESARTELRAVGRRIAKGGLVVGSGGNVSVRVDDHVLISTRRAELGALTDEECVLVPIRDDSEEKSQARASSELPLHRAIYQTYNVEAVVHTHSTHAVVMSTLTSTLPAVHYAQAQLGGEIAVAPYAGFGTRELADVTVAALKGRSAALMQNHGAVATGSTLHGALQAAELTEWLCQLAYMARVGGGGSLIDADELANVARRAANWGRGTKK